MDEHYSWPAEPLRVYRRSLWLSPNRALPGDRDLRLRIGWAEYPVSGMDERTWRDPDFFWQVGDRAPVSLVEVAPSVPPVAVDTPDSDDPHAELIAQMWQWCNDPHYVSDKVHTDRWDRALLTFGETVNDPTLELMTSTEAQGYADRGWSRWEGVAEALRELEAAAQLVQADPQPTQGGAAGPSGPGQRGAGRLGRTGRCRHRPGERYPDSLAGRRVPGSRHRRPDDQRGLLESGGGHGHGLSRRLQPDRDRCRDDQRDRPRR